MNEVNDVLFFARSVCPFQNTKESRTINFFTCYVHVFTIINLLTMLIIIVIMWFPRVSHYFIFMWEKWAAFIWSSKNPQLWSIHYSIHYQGFIIWEYNQILDYWLLISQNSLLHFHVRFNTFNTRYMKKVYLIHSIQDA